MVTGPEKQPINKSEQNATEIVIETAEVKETHIHAESIVFNASPQAELGKQTENLLPPIHEGAKVINPGTKKPHKRLFDETGKPILTTRKERLVRRLIKEEEKKEKESRKLKKINKEKEAELWKKEIQQVTDLVAGIYNAAELKKREAEKATLKPKQTINKIKDDDEKIKARESRRIRKHKAKEARKENNINRRGVNKMTGKEQEPQKRPNWLQRNTKPLSVIGAGVLIGGSILIAKGCETQKEKVELEDHNRIELSTPRPSNAGGKPETTIVITEQPIIVTTAEVTTPTVTTTEVTGTPAETPSEAHAERLIELNQVFEEDGIEAWLTAAGITGNIQISARQVEQETVIDNNGQPEIVASGIQISGTDINVPWPDVMTTDQPVLQNERSYQPDPNNPSKIYTGVIDYNGNATVYVDGQNWSQMAPGK